MKTAVSLPDEIYEQASRRAKELGISRSELVTRALRAFLREARAAEIQESYDEAFGAEGGEDDTADLRRAATRRRFADIEW